MIEKDWRTQVNAFAFTYQSLHTPSIAPVIILSPLHVTVQMPSECAPATHWLVLNIFPHNLLFSRTQPPSLSEALLP